MPFSDQDLAKSMSTELVNSGLMTSSQLASFITGDSTENAVRETLTSQQLANFQTYWQSLGKWMSDNGGNIATTTAMNVDGRTLRGVSAIKPVGIGLVPLYNDAFYDTNTYIGKPNFSVVKAVSNQLRFIDVMLDVE